MGRTMFIELSAACPICNTKTLISETETKKMLFISAVCPKCSWKSSAPLSK